MTEVAKTKTTYYYNEYELETQTLNKLPDKSFQVLLKFNEINRNNNGNVLSVKALFNNLGDQVFDIEVKSSIFDRGSNSENGVFNLKLPISEEDKAKPFLLMAKVFNSVQTTNLVTTIAKYNKLQSNTLSMKLFGKNRVSTTTSKIFKVIGLESIANSSDGVNYTLKGATTIKSDESLSIPLGKNIKFDQPFTNNGEVIIGSNNSESVKSAKENVNSTVEVKSNITNKGKYQINSRITLIIDSGVTFTNAREFYNYGTFNINGTFDNTTCYETSPTVYNVGPTTINSGGILKNSGTNSYLENDYTIYGDGTLDVCQGKYVDNGTTSVIIASC